MMLTEQQVLAEATRRYPGSICCDSLTDALECESLDDAVHVLLLDTVMWDSPEGNPCDPAIWQTILPVQAF